MMINEPRHHYHHRHAMPWAEAQIQTSSPTPSSPPSTGTPPLSPSASYAAVMSSLRRCLFSTPAAADPEPPPPTDFSSEIDFPFPPADDDDFFMYEFKVRKCTRVRAHDWTECPFAHPGEKARRRDPRKYDYSGTACSDFRKGGCRKGDNCELAHGVFECWLHPSRYRTQACKDGSGCRRRVCFFAHHPGQLRPSSGMGSSPRGSQNSGSDFPDDGIISVGSGSGSVSELMASLRNLQLSRVKSMPNSWAGGGLQIGSPVFGSPRAGSVSVTRPGFFSLPTTPTRPRIGCLDWENLKDCGEEGEPVMVRVESGRELRVRMFEKLSKENPLNGSGSVEPSGSGPDLGWISDLVK